MPEPLDDLKSLVSSDGWQQFCRYARSQWSDDFVIARVTAAVRGVAAGDELTQNESVRNVLAGREAVLNMLAWPEQEIARLAAHNAPVGKQTIVEQFKRAVGR